MYVDIERRMKASTLSSQLLSKTLAQLPRLRYLELKNTGPRDLEALQDMVTAYCPLLQSLNVTGVVSCLYSFPIVPLAYNVTPVSRTCEGVLAWTPPRFLLTSIYGTSVSLPATAVRTPACEAL